VIRMNGVSVGVCVEVGAVVWVEVCVGVSVRVGATVGVWRIWYSLKG
jgi:hypothetical protein